jgi:hypothetical protein
VPYNFSQSVNITNGSTKITMYLPNRDHILMNSIDFVCNVNLTIDSGSTWGYFENGMPIIDRVKVSNSNVVLSDQLEMGLISSIHRHNSETIDDRNSYESFRKGLEQGTTESSYVDLKASSGSNKQYILKLSPKGGLLNCNGVIPLWRVGGKLQIEITFAAPSKCCVTDGAIGTTNYDVSDMQIRYSALKSNTLQQKYKTGPFSFNFTENNWSFQSLTDQKNSIRFHVANRSVKYILIALRPEASINDVTAVDKNSSFYSGANLADFQCYINNRPVYEESITELPLMWEELKKAFPSVATFRYFTKGLFDSTRNLFCINLAGLPQFEESIISGVRSSNVVGGLYCNLTFTDTPASTVHADVFYGVDSLLKFDPSRNLLETIS